MSVNSRFGVNEKEVSGKVIDSEAIIINLSNGMYYSMDKVGGLIWELIEQTYSVEEMVSVISERYVVAPGQAQADVERLMAELVQENLVVASDNQPTRDDNRSWAAEEKLAYETPQLNIYRDMGNLLALDPPMPGLTDMAWKAPEAETTP